MLYGKHKTLFDRLIDTIDKKRIFHYPLHTLAYGTDASFYRLIPETIKSGYSNSRTCEIGLSLHSGISYKSIVYLVDMVSKTKTD